MCRSDQEGGHRCTDHRRHRETPIDDIRPDPAPDRPAIDWAANPASTPEQLYHDYPGYIAALVVDLMTAAKQQEAAMTSDVLAALPSAPGCMASPSG